MEDTTQLLAGTSGYSFKEWYGHFYPEKLPAKAMLRYYAERLSTVEINATFYRMPSETMLERWATEVPAHFAFTLKAPRRITHHKQLADAGPDATEFLRRAATLGTKLGTLLFQLPPSFKKDLGRLTEFIDQLPPRPRVTFEFRHPSWHTDAVYETLRTHGSMLCVTDTDEGDTPFVATCDQGYLRLRRSHYGDRELKAWLARIAAQPLARAYVYFMHEDQALGIGFAQRMMKLRGPQTAES